MSKIAEEKALEAYPPEYEQEDFDETWDMNIQYREPYIQGYDQAMRDFLEKAYTFLKNRTMPELCLDSELTELVDDFVEQFKNYMQDEN